jgi:hypothetical protein
MTATLQITPPTVYRALEDSSLFFYAHPMDGRDLVDLWENQHGKLTTDSRERFLASPEAQKIRAYPTDSIIRAIGVSPTLSKILLELQSTRRIQAQISPQAPKRTSPKPRQKAAPDYTRKIASEKGRGFRQAEEDAKKWRGRF